jgi:hypothetical protein
LFSLVVFFIKTFLHQIQCLFFTTKFYISFFLSLYFICPIYFAVCVWGDRCWRWSHVPFTAENIESPGRKWKHYNRIHHNTGTINLSIYYNRIHYNTGIINLQHGQVLLAKHFSQLGTDSYPRFMKKCVSIISTSYNLILVFTWGL